MVFFEVLAREKSNIHSGVWQLLAIVSGFMVMCILQASSESLKIKLKQPTQSTFLQQYLSAHHSRSRITNIIHSTIIILFGCVAFPEQVKEQGELATIQGKSILLFAMLLCSQSQKLISNS